MFLSIVAVFKLECLKIKHKMNHFALRMKRYIKATEFSLGRAKNPTGRVKSVTTLRYDAREYGSGEQHDYRDKPSGKSRQQVKITQQRGGWVTTSVAPM